jgi:histidinol-phosphatase
MSRLDSDLELALRFADDARAISLAMFRGSFGHRRKADGSIVTDADEAIERAIRARLAAERPDDAMLGEEFGETGSGRRRWVVDAIDGTHSFATGSELWGTLIALEIDGEVVVGICDMAAMDRRYQATRGGGAFCVERGATRRLTVSRCEGLADARCYVPGDEWMPDAAAKARADALRATTSAVGADDHPALLVARGTIDVACFFRAGPWDIAAPSIVVDEAGGRFSDLIGGKSIATGECLFTNGAVHADVLGIVGRHPSAKSGVS